MDLAPATATRSRAVDRRLRSRLCQEGSGGLRAGKVSEWEVGDVGAIVGVVENYVGAAANPPGNAARGG